MEERKSRWSPSVVRAVVGGSLTAALTLMSALLGLMQTGPPDWRMPLLVALVGSTLTVATDLSMKLDALRTDGLDKADQIKAETRRHIKTIELEPKIKALQDGDLEFVVAVTEHFNRLRASGHPFFQDFCGKLQDEFQERVRGLADGTIVIDPSAHFHTMPTFRSDDLDQFTMLDVVHLGAIEYWRSEHGRIYFEHQKRSIRASGLKVRRVFVLERGQREGAADIVAAHVHAEIDVKIADLTRIREENGTLLEDYCVATDKEGRRMLITPRENDGRFDATIKSRYGERLVAKKEIIDRKAFSFEELWRRSERAEDAYPRLRAKRKAG
ncbi:hypothetical protein GCM10023194_50540 [Planotetraspora phitsanulokensis]|uniref:Uncharacterized protein n=1 Tax=Planotetraspora phitsanulokensis TaxID=575192 RepID=A0A8J3U1J6_9ACTN|nr:hypothetical protein [Planotetraspora phitsanulokensis]GII36868.1 hypothetical protein Pph01_18710 [Planotetraspora phitsanulokensis]